MAEGLNTFINTDPTQENIRALVSSSQVIGLTVSTTDCNSQNFQRSLAELSSITIDGLNSDQPIDIISKTAKGAFYYYEVDPFPISGQLNGNSCLLTTLNPFVEQVGFDNSDFNIIFNNVTASRPSTYIQDVDRVRGAVTASNMQNILDDTAIKAMTPDSNYTALAHRNGRYDGSKTSVTDYGVSSALGVRVFEGADYLVSLSSTVICSEDLSDRNLKEYVYTGIYDFPVAGDRIFTLEGNIPLPLRNRQVWVRKNTKVYATDSEGYTTNNGSLCPTP